jgi:hypothetical protein
MQGQEQKIEELRFKREEERAGEDFQRSSVASLKATRELKP